jgi:DNA mismatch repair ATPase MutS
MNQLQRDILFWLRESKKERGLSVSQIAFKVKRDEQKIIVELGILADSQLIEVELSPSRRIKRAKVNAQGENYFKDETTIITKESVKEQISNLKERIMSLEESFNKLQENPTDENKKTFLEKMDTLQSVINGIAPLVKSGFDFFK